MKIFASLTLAALILVPQTALRAAENESLREHLSLDEGWKFHLGDDWPDALVLSKAGSAKGPAAEKFNDAAWRVLNLPHDWAIELPFDQSADKNHGFKALGPGFPANSIGWYRRTFELPAGDEDKRIWLQFDGAFRNTTVWVNGWLVKRHEGGYYPFREDITDVIRFGARNTVSVKVDASRFEGWFYEGAGIYRHVWLDKTGPVAIAPDGIFVRCQFPNNIPGGNVKVQIETSLLNTLPATAKTRIGQEIINPEGHSVATLEDQVEVPDHGTNGSVASIDLNSPILWSPDSPKLYQLVTTVTVDGKVVDRKKTEFGIRTVAFDKDKGFLLNGKPCWLKGTCNHQDHAGVGAAMPDALQYYRIAKLKEMGCNAYRTSHNPPTPELLDACDRLGMLVMDENRLLGSDEENLRKLESQVLRDRNHPSVIVWSLANEEFAVQSSKQAGNVALTMQNLVNRLDPTRSVTYAAPQGDVFEGINGVIEVRGWNYNVGPGMDKYHAEHPDQPNVGTEDSSFGSTRGIYVDDRNHGYVSAYGRIRNLQSPSFTWWTYFAERPWLSGGFIWTGFDYRGEPSPCSWPCISSHFGLLDTCGFPKDGSYYYKSWWTSGPVLHLLPHWNWAGKEGQDIQVVAFSNCKEVELFLNGTSLGKQSMKPNAALSWNVKYAPGTLSAKGFNGGKVVAETKVETTGEPGVITLTPDRSSIRADGEDLSLVTVAVTDSSRRVVPTAGNKINFALSGPGRIIGVGNGDPTCHEPDTMITPPPVVDKTLLHENTEQLAWSRSVFNGVAQVILQSTKKDGEITLTATADGLKPAIVTIRTQPAPTRPSVP